MRRGQARSGGARRIRTFPAARGSAPLALLVAVVIALLPLTTAPPAAAAKTVPALRVLNALPVGKEARDGYSRDLFRLWSDLDGDGCDTREQVLIDERSAGTVVGCRVVNGTWVSAYDGVVTTDSSRFDIDHVVPLAEAWDSGAWNWSASRRERFANDTGYGGSLIAVSASSNRAKGDRDPAEWMPARGRCAYAKTWIAVKYRWRLAVDAAEKAALRQILANCPPGMTLPPLAPSAGIGDGTRPAPAPPAPSASSSSSSPSDGGLDPRFRTCGDANAAGFGPYTRGIDPEYDWYIDRDGDGVACER